VRLLSKKIKKKQKLKKNRKDRTTSQFFRFVFAPVLGCEFMPSVYIYDKVHVSRMNLHTLNANKCEHFSWMDLDFYIHQENNVELSQQMILKDRQLRCFDLFRKIHGYGSVSLVYDITMMNVCWRNILGWVPSIKFCYNGFVSLWLDKSRQGLIRGT